MSIMMVTSINSYTKSMEMKMKWQKKQTSGDYAADGKTSIDDSTRSRLEEIRKREKAFVSGADTWTVATWDSAVLCIENLPRTCLGRNSGEIMRLIENYPDVMVCFDSNHLLQEEHAHFFETVGSRIGTIHASDYDRQDERHWLPGNGVIDWTDFYRRLRASGYKGVFMHEVRAGEDATPANIAARYESVILGKKKK